MSYDNGPNIMNDEEIIYLSLVCYECVGFSDAVVSNIQDNLESKVFLA